MNFVSKDATLCMLAATIAVSHNNATTGTERFSRRPVVDELTNWVFYCVNPELNHRQLRPNEYGYIREWQNLRSAIDEKVVPSTQASLRGEMGRWEFSPAPGQSFAQAYDELADVIFNSRNPQRQGRAIAQTETAAAKAWAEIRAKIYIPTSDS